jgi:hypothetical protein
VTNDPKWTILVPTLGQREELFARLMGVLLPQLDAYPQVRLLAWRNNGRPTLGEIRDGLIAAAIAAGAEYVSFIDDDDLVPEYYVAEIVNALVSRPDHVGFKLEYTTNDTGREIVEHSLRYSRWGRTDGVLHRDFTHLDPIRAVFAREGLFSLCRSGRAEDRVWVKQVRRHLVTESYIDKIMYHYLFRDDTTSWQDPKTIVPKAGRPAIDHPAFAWHHESDD